jgi:hypothetical protein
MRLAAPKSKRQSLRPYAVRHERDRPGVATIRASAALHAHPPLEGVPRGEPADEAVLAGRRRVGHESAERATGTSRGHASAHGLRFVAPASKLPTPLEEPHPM